jgi:hypothetical protein
MIVRKVPEETVCSLPGAESSLVKPGKSRQACRFRTTDLGHSRFMEP